MTRDATSNQARTRDTHREAPVDAVLFDLSGTLVDETYIRHGLVALATDRHERWAIEPARTLTGFMPAWREVTAEHADQRFTIMRDVLCAAPDRLLASCGQHADGSELVAPRDRLLDSRDHLRQLDARQSSRRLLVRHIHAVMRHQEPPMFEIHTRQVPAQRVMSIQRRLHADETDAFVAEAKAAFVEHLAGRQPTGPFTLIFHGIVDHDESDGPLEAILGGPDDIAPTNLIGIRTEPAHDEAFTPISKAQWDYPAILAAYDAVARSPQAQARPGSRLSCREVYLAEPDTIGDDDLICDIAFPLG